MLGCDVVDTVRTMSVVMGCAIVLSACLLEPNPGFVEPTGSESGGADATGSETDASESDSADDNCSPGWLDCDEEPGCESEASDAQTCGSCENSCVLGGQALSCVEGTCTGTVMLAISADTYADEETPEQAFGDEPLLEIEDLPAQHTYIALPGLDELPPDAEIEGAILTLSCSNGGIGASVHLVEGPWDEASLTWTQAPQLGESLLSFDAVEGLNEVDLSPLLPELQLGSSHGVALLPTDDDGMSFASSETDMGPLLHLTVSW